MNNKSTQPKPTPEAPLIVIVGPTASGKSATAMQIAIEYGGEIICADSRTIYSGMDIGTAKPSLDDRREVAHWGLDLVEPGDVFTASDFKKYSEDKIKEVRSRGNIPIVVGGSGLYIDGLIFDYQFVEPQPKLRQELEALSLEELKDYCVNNNVELPENEKNRRYVIRAIEHKNTSFKRLNEPIPNTLIVGITTNRDKLRLRIAKRTEQLLADGMVEEAKMLGEKYGWDSQAMTGNAYRLVRQFLDGDFEEAELIQRFNTADWHLAKKQLTWFKRNKFINWVELDEAVDFIKLRLS